MAFMRPGSCQNVAAREGAIMVVLTARFWGLANDPGGRGDEMRFRVGGRNVFSTTVGEWKRKKKECGNEGCLKRGTQQ